MSLGHEAKSLWSFVGDAHIMSQDVIRNRTFVHGRILVRLEMLQSIFGNAIGCGAPARAYRPQRQPHTTRNVKVASCNLGEGGAGTKLAVLAASDIGRFACEPGDVWILTRHSHTFLLGFRGWESPVLCIPGSGTIAVGLVVLHGSKGVMSERQKWQRTT
nr:hypothetical protein CFP56_50400 [Quercus suber]